MICAPRQTILLCVAALVVNAAASEFEKTPAIPVAGDIAGRSPFVVKNGRVQYVTSWLRRAGEFLRAAFEESPGLARASEKLEQGDYAAFLGELIRTASAASDPGRFAARLFLAENALEQKKCYKAYAFYLSVYNDGDVPAALALQATQGALESLIQVNEDQTALELLEKEAVKFPEKQMFWEKLRVFLLGRIGKYSELEKYWASVKERHPHAPEPLLYEGLFKGAETASADQISKCAERFYADAFNFAVTNAERRNCLKKLILLQEKADPERALRSIDRYLIFFPRAADAGNVTLKKGEILTGLKKNAQALELFRKVLNDRKYKVDERIHAAFRGAALSEKNGNISVAREFYNSAIRRFADRPEFVNQVKMQLLEFLIRTKEYSSAAMLGDELSGIPGVDYERLNISRLKALSELKRYADAARIASDLASSSKPFYAAEGAWQLAHLKQLQGQNKEAQRLYLVFAERFSGDKRVPEALLAAVDFSIKAKDFKSAYQRLEMYLTKFPDHKGVRKAMGAAVFSLLHYEAAGNREKAEQMFQKMAQTFPDSAECDQAALELIRYFTRHDEHAAALKLLESFLKKRTSSSMVPEVLLQGAVIMEKMGSLGKAVEYADRLLDKYPNSPFAVEAAMLGGSCSFQQKKYEQALKYYERACELGGRGVMAQVAAGEAADCHLQLRKKENIAAAVRLYRELAGRTEFPALQVQALFKLGTAYEIQNDSMKALRAYEELLFLAVRAEKVRRSAGTALWCARSAHAGLRIILSNPHMPDGSQRAQRLYRLYSQLDLPGSRSELRRYLEEIREHYNLLD